LNRSIQKPILLAWHPALGLLTLALPSAIAAHIASIGKHFGVDKVMGVLAVASSAVGNRPDIYAFLLFNWATLPVLVWAMFFWLGPLRIALTRRVAIRNALLCFALAAVLVWFFALQNPPSSNAMPIGRGYFLIRLAESAAIGLFAVHCATSWLCAVCVAAGVKYLFHIFNE